MSPNCSKNAATHMTNPWNKPPEFSQKFGKNAVGNKSFSRPAERFTPTYELCMACVMQLKRANGLLFATFFGLTS